MSKPRISERFACEEYVQVPDTSCSISSFLPDAIHVRTSLSVDSIAARSWSIDKVYAALGIQKRRSTRFSVSLDFHRFNARDAQLRELMLSARWAVRTPILRTAPKLPANSHRVPNLRTYASSPPSTPPKNAKRPGADRFDFNTRPENSSAANSEHVNYRHVTANDLESFTEPPQRVKMLVRDYIEDALYNPNYGYFPKQATIFTGLEKEVDFSKIRDSNEFQEIVARQYDGYGKDEDGPGRQIFHTPTELFRVRASFKTINTLEANLSLLATLRTSYCAMYCLGVPSQILPVRRPQSLRDWCRKRITRNGCSQLHPGATSRSLRTDKVYYY